ncbi:DUF7673 family protein [Shimia thalassica]|nr:hypothetical protein [Shimia thalassica]
MNNLNLEKISHRTTVQNSYDSLYEFAVRHDTPSSRVAGDVILATYNSETFKFDFHEIHSLSTVNIRAVLTILANHLKTREDAVEYLSEDQIDRLKVSRGFPAHTEFLQTGCTSEG